jgi:two-component system, OmpR family, response regulator ChvI
MSKHYRQEITENKKARILIVDDDHDITLTFRVALLQHGFLVDVFNVYDLLLLDIKMPKMNGFELYRELEKIDNKTKVCFITSFVTYYESLRDIFPMTNVSCFIKKPIEIGILADRLRAELR